MYSDVLSHLREEESVISAALIRRDGTLVASYPPEHTMTESFPIMCATVLGAAITANSELNIGEMSDVVISAGKGTTIIKDAGNHLLLVISIGENGDVAIVSQVLDRLKKKTRS